MRVPHFWTDRKGGVLPLFAIAMIPVIGFVGVAIDYSRAASARTSMQTALDGATLMLSKDAAKLTQTELNQRAGQYVNALLNRPELQSSSYQATYTAIPASLTITAAGSMATDFMGIFGISNLNVASSSTVRWGNARLRVALALDNTGSMALSDKMSALRSASHGLLSQLQNAASQNGDVYVSIVPFNKDVNVGASNFGESWIKWTEWNAANGQWCKKNGQCSATQETGNATWTPNEHSTWNGCVTDRDQNYDTTNTEVSTIVPGTMMVAEQYAQCPVSMMGLSYDWSALNQRIEAMYPAGNTNQAIGLQMAWQSLTSAPFTIPAKDPNYEYRSVIILLTDGMNTQDRWYWDQGSIDARQKMTCDNIKSAGITLYTVQVNTDGQPTSTLLQQCASDSEKFFLLTSATEMVSVFSQIGTNLSQLRIAK
jgi:Flp pilus assembly protein TadG